MCTHRSGLQRLSQCGIHSTFGRVFLDHPVDFVQFPYWGRLKLRSPTIHCTEFLGLWVDPICKIALWERKTSYLRCNPSLLDMSSFVRCLLAVSAVRGPKSSKSTKVRVAGVEGYRFKNVESQTKVIKKYTLPECTRSNRDLFHDSPPKHTKHLQLALSAGFAKVIPFSGRRWRQWLCQGRRF